MSLWKNEWHALSMSQPWLELVLRGTKRVENRRRCIGRPRLPFILHGAKSTDEAGAREFLTSRGLGPTVPDMLKTVEDATIELALTLQQRRGFCGVARSVGVLQPHDGKAPGIELRVENRLTVYRFDLAWWMREQWGYLLADVRALPTVPGKGMLGFFRVDPGIVRELGLPPTPEEYLARAA